MKKEYRPQIDGRRAYLPLPILQSPLFGHQKKDKDNMFVWSGLNAGRDSVRISSFRPLMPSPDMDTLISTVALYQRHAVMAGDTGKGSTTAEFGMSELYDLMHVDRRRQKLIWDSIRLLGSTEIHMHFSRPELHYGQEDWRTSGLWLANEIKVRGRCGSRLIISPIDAFIPQTDKAELCLQAEICCSLRSVSAKQIFWILTSSSHLSISRPELMKICGYNYKRLDKFEKYELLPAMEELGNFGYDFRLDRHNWTLESPVSIRRREKALALKARND